MVKNTGGPTPGHQDRILEAAAATFLEKGFESTSTAEIASLAKVSKRELYACFADKRSIFSAVIAQLQEEFQSQMNVSWTSSEDLGAILAQAGADILRFVHSEKFGRLFRIVAAESSRDPESAEKFYLLGPRMGRRNTASFMRRQMAAGNLRKADPLKAADDFLDLIISARHLTSVVLGQNDEVSSARKHVKHAVEVFLCYYAAPAGSGKRPRTAGKPRK